MMQLNKKRKTKMKNRPTSISVIAWLLVVAGGITLIMTTVMINNPMVNDIMSKSSIPIPLQHAMSYLGSLIMIVSGIAMLKGCNWARFLYIIWNIIGFLVGIATSPMKAAMIPGFVFLLIVAFFLFRPKANTFFSSAGDPNDA